jgi:hypothetical protein
MAPVIALPFQFSSSRMRWRLSLPVPQSPLQVPLQRMTVLRAGRAANEQKAEQTHERRDQHVGSREAFFA